MAKARTNEAGGMSPLARRLRAKQDNGLSYREMERMALAQGVRYTSSSFEQVAKDQRADRLGVDALRAIGIVLDLTPEEVAAIDDQRWGLRHVALKDNAGDVDLRDIPDDVVLSEAARRLAARNPDAKR